MCCKRSSKDPDTLPGTRQVNVPAHQACVCVCVCQVLFLRTSDTTNLYSSAGGHPSHHSCVQLELMHQQSQVRRGAGYDPTSTAPGWDEPNHPELCDSWQRVLLHDTYSTPEGPPHTVRTPLSPEGHPKSGPLSSYPANGLRTAHQSSGSVGD